jgi:hypothetical protein
LTLEPLPTLPAGSPAGQDGLPHNSAARAHPGRHRRPDLPARSQPGGRDLVRDRWIGVRVGDHEEMSGEGAYVRKPRMVPHTF